MRSRSFSPEHEEPHRDRLSCPKAPGFSQPPSKLSNIKQAKTAISATGQAIRNPAQFGLHACSRPDLSLPRPVVAYALASFPPDTITFQASALLILPCQPAHADRPPARPGSLHETKGDGCRVIARKDGEQARLWARTTSDYSKAFTCIREPVAALPVDSAVIDGVAVVFRCRHFMRCRPR